MELVTRTGEWLEYEFFQGLRRLDAVARWARWASPPAEEPDDRKVMGRQVERLAADLIADRGWPVQMAGGNEAWDVWAGGAKVEIKAARWYTNGEYGGRYQAMIRNGQADLVVMACVDDDQVWAWFLIPAAVIGKRRNIAISSLDPRAYQGQWARYLERWDLVDEVVEAAGAYPAQLSFEFSVSSFESGVSSSEFGD